MSNRKSAKWCASPGASDSRTRSGKCVQAHYALLASSIVVLLFGMPLATADAESGIFGLDKLLQEPSLIGVAPRQAVWSPDAETLAFTWDDAGGDFQNVWVLRAGEDVPRQTTRHSPSDGGGPGVSELVFADNGRIAYVLGDGIYITDLDGNTERMEGDIESPRQLKLSPNGNFLSYVSGGPASGYLHDFQGDGSLWLRPAGAKAGDVSRKLLGDGLERTFVESYEWAEDSKQIAFMLADNTEVPERDIHYYSDGGKHQVYRFSRSFPGDETTRRRLGVLQTADASVRWLRLVDERYPIWNYGLSADGKRLFANTSNFVVKEHRIFMFDVDSGERTLFHAFDDPQNVVPGWRAEWAPADNGLIVQTDHEGYYHLYHIAEKGGEPRALTSGEWEVASFEVDSERNRVYFVANESHLSERQLYRVSLAGGEIDRLTSQPGTWEPTFASDFSRVALDFSSDKIPPDLYALDLDSEAGASIRQVTRSPIPAFDSYVWAEVTYPEFESHRDGMKIFGRLSLPPDFDAAKEYPLIVGSVYANTVRNQWGRGRSPVWALDEHLVSKGYLILKVNVRGSWGQGKAFSRGLIRDYGGIDTDDIESAVRDLIDEGFVDPDRVGIWGNSYGGLMTLMSLFKKPGLYAAGIAGAPASNVWHAYPGQMWVMGERRGSDYPERYSRQSALYQTKGLEDPLMILHGTRDPIVLYSDTIALVERLIAQGKMFELVTLPAASHGWAADNPGQTRFAFRKMVDFFDRHLAAPAGR